MNIDQHKETFFIKTFGCQMNERDSEIMAQLLREAGYSESFTVDDASLVILNTCSIRAKAEQKVMSLLGHLRKNLKKNPALKICVAGCVAQQEGVEIIKKMPHVTLVIGTQNIYQLVPALQYAAQGGSRVVTSLAETYDIPRFLPNFSAQTPAPPFRKFITIMQGCNNFCSYCVVPHTRGREVSRMAVDIVDEARVLVENGVKEITLLGQNVNSYGRTNSVVAGGGRKGYGFASLLKDVATLADSGLQRLRFTTSNPKDLDDELIACFADIDILCAQLHLPVQAGSDSVLKKMNRKYSIAGYLSLVEKLHKVCPSIALTTDIIVGFPGETDADFEETMTVLDTVRYHGSFSFKYSPRPGTRAADFLDAVPEEVKSARLTRFQQRQDEISLERNQEYVGSIQQIMLEPEMGTTLLSRGRTESNHIVHLQEPFAGMPGDIIPARIIHAGQHSLQGAAEVSG